MATSDPRWTPEDMINALATPIEKRILVLITVIKDNDFRKDVLESPLNGMASAVFADILDVPRDQVNAALLGLIKKGLIEK